MARRNRFAPPGYWLHLTQRGNYRQTVFSSDADREHFLSLLDEFAHLIWPTWTGRDYDSEMDRRSKVELFEESRRGHAAGETVLGLAKQHGVHRRMVRQAIANEGIILLAVYPHIS